MAEVTCPICRRKVPSPATTPTYPFCSKRCKLVDLGNWLSDSYVIPSSMADDNVEDLDEEILAALLREPS
jgi:endogenous inhibitor of DNA gyrase (YacG/DUF329 family)